MNVVSQSKGERQTKKMPKNTEVNRRAIRGRNAVESTRARPTEQLQLSRGSALLSGAKIQGIQT